MKSAMKTASDYFYVIDRGKRDIVTPYDSESKYILDKYIEENDIAKKNSLLRKLQRYSISLYSHEVEELEKKNALYEYDGVTVLDCGYYDAEFGLNFGGSPPFLQT